MRGDRFQSRAGRRRIAQGLLLGLLLAAGAAAAETGARLPEDARLEPVRVQLEAVVEQSTQAGLPAEMLVSKVREGLAKQVAPQRILDVVSNLATDLASARAFAVPLVPGGRTQPALLRAFVDAKAAGVKWAEIKPLAASQRGSEGLTRAIAVLTELASRGYPTDHAIAVITQVIARDPGALPHLPADLDRVRRLHGLTQAETLDAVAGALGQPGNSGDALERVLQRLSDSGAPSSEHGRGPNRDSSGSHGKK